MISTLRLRTTAALMSACAAASLLLAAGPAASVDLRPRNLILADRSADPFGFRDSRGAIFVVDEGPPIQIQIAASPDGFVDPVQTLPLSDGRIIVVDGTADAGGGRASGLLWIIDPSETLPGRAELFAWSPQWDNPSDVLQEPSGNLLVLDADADPLGAGTRPGALYRVLLDSRVVTPLATSAYWVEPRSMAFDIDGSILVWDARSDPYALGGLPGALFRVNPTTGFVEIVFSKSDFLSPWAIEVSPTGDYLLLDRDANPNGHPGAPGGIYRIRRSTLEVEPLVFPSQFSEPVDCVRGDGTKLYVLDARANPFGLPTATGALFRCDLLTGQVTNTVSSGFFRSLTGLSQFASTALDSSLVTWEDLSGPPFQPGDRLRVTVRARNTGAVPGRPVTMEHTLGPDWSYRLGSATAQKGTLGYDPGARRITWTGDMEVQEEVEIAYEIRLREAVAPGFRLQEKVQLKVGRTASLFNIEVQTAYRSAPGRYLWADYDPASGIVFEMPFGALVPTRVYSGAPLVQPDDVAFFPDGTLAILDRRSHPAGPGFPPGGIYRLDPYTLQIVDTLLIVADHPELRFLTGIAAGSFDELLVIDKDANPYNLPGLPGAVFSFNVVTGTLTLIASDARFSEPSDAVLASTGEILVVDYDADPGGDNPRGGGLFEVDRASGQVEPILVPPGNFVDPIGLAEGIGRRIFVSDLSANPLGLPANTGAIFEIRRTLGNQLVVASADSLYVDPTDVWVQRDGSLIVTDREANPRHFSPRDRGAVFRVRPFSGPPQLVTADPGIYGPEAVAGFDQGSLSFSALTVSDENGLPTVAGDVLRFEANIRNTGRGLVPEAMVQVLLSDELSLLDANGPGGLTVDPSIGAVAWLGRLAPVDTVKIMIRAQVGGGYEYGHRAYGVMHISGPTAPPADSAFAEIVAPLRSTDLVLVDSNADPEHQGSSRGALFHLRSDRGRVEHVLKTDSSWVDPSSLLGLDEGRLLLADPRGQAPGVIQVVDYLRDTVGVYLADPRLGSPADLYRTRSGDLLIVDSGATLQEGEPPTPVIWKQPHGQGPIEVLCADTLLVQPNEMAEDDEGRLWVLDRRSDPNRAAPGRGALFRLDPQSGTILDTLQFGVFTLPSGLLNWPGEGLLVVDEFSVTAPNTRGAIFQLDPDAGTARVRLSDPRFRQIHRAALTPGGELWISDRIARDETKPGAPRTLFRWDPETDEVEPVAASEQYVSPGEIYALPGPNPRIASYVMEDLDGEPLRPGDQIRVRARIENVGPVTTAGAVYRDTLPPLILMDPTTIRADAGVVLTPGLLNGLEWTTDLPPGASYEIRYEGRVHAAIAQGTEMRLRSHLRTAEGLHRVRRIAIRLPVFFEDGFLYVADADADPFNLGGSPGCIWKISMVSGQSIALSGSSQLVEPVQALQLPTTEPNVLLVDGAANPHGYLRARGCLWRWIVGTTGFEVVAADTLFRSPTAAAVVDEGEVLLLDRLADPFDLRAGLGPGAVFRIDVLTGNVTTVASDSLFTSPRDLVADGHGSVFIVDSDADPYRYGLRNGAVFRLDLATGKVTVFAASAEFRGPVAAGFGPDGEFYVLDRDVRPLPDPEARGALFRVDANGNVSRTATSRFFRRLSDFEFDPQGRLWITDAEADPLRRGFARGAVFRRDLPTDPEFRVMSAAVRFENPSGFFLRQSVTAIELTAFEAEPAAEGVVLTWRVPDATFDGFVLWRAEGADPDPSEYVALNPLDPVPGSGPFRFVDRESEAGHLYSYLIEPRSSETGGSFYGPVHALAQTVRVFAFHPPAPNPARSTVSLRFDLPAPGTPDLTLYDLSGRRVRRIQPGPLPAGRHLVTWDTRNDRDHPVASGLYLARLTWRDRAATRRIIVLR